jgi:hypothetical protein
MMHCELCLLYFIRKSGLGGNVLCIYIVKEVPIDQQSVQYTRWVGGAREHIRG